MLARIERAQSPEVAREMSAVVLQMSASVDLLADAARGFNLDRLGAEIGRSLEQSVINHMSPPLERLASEVRDLRQSHENQREEMLRSVIDELNTRVFLPITGQIRDLATQLARSDETTQTLVSAVKITSDDLTRLSASIHDSLESMRETQQATYAELQKYANFLSDTLTKSNEILAKQHRAFEISAQRSAEMLEKVREDTHKMFEGFTHTLAHEAAEILRRARIEVEQGLQEVPKMLTAVREETTTQLTQFREEYQHRLQSFMDQQRDALAEQRASFTESARQSADLLTQVRNDSRTMLEDVTQRVLKSAEEILSRARQEVEQSLHVVPAMLTSVREETTMQLTQFRETYQARLGEFMTRQNDALEAQRAASEETATASTEMLRRAREEVERGMREVPERLAAMRDETTAQLTSFREEYQGRLQSFMDQQRDALATQRDSFEESARHSAALLTQVRDDSRVMLDEVKERVVKSAVEILKDARAEVEKSLQAVPQMLTDVREETQRQLTDFREEYQRRLTEFMTQQSAILNEVLGEQREALAGIVRELQQVFEREYARRRELGEETSGHIQRVAESGRLLNELSSMLGAQSAVILPKIAEASQHVAEQMRGAYQQYQQLERTFSSSAASFSTSSAAFGEQVQRALVGVQERQDRLFADQDEHLKQIFDHLLQVTENLSLVVREIQSEQRALSYDRQGR